MNFILFDIILAAALLIFAIRGYSRGFILTLCSLLAVFVAFIGASILSDALAQPVAQSIVPVVERGLRGSVGSYYEFSAPEDPAAEEGFFDALPLEGALEALGESSWLRGLADSFRSALDEGAAEITGNVVRALAEFMAAQIARMVLFFLFFVVILIGWTILSHALDLVAKLPILNALNRWGGAAAGLLKGSLLIFIALWIFRDMVPAQAVADTHLLNFFYTTSPLDLFL